MIEKIVTAAQLPGYFRFKMALKNPEKTQRERLAQILRAVGNTQSSRKFRIDSDMNYKQFSQNIPLTDYMYWEKQILSQKLSGANLICYDVKRYQPTSGSSSAHKWIPYSQEFMSELDSATQAWLGDVGRQNPNAFRGAQYWSLSWLPQDQRADRPSNDDLELLPAWKRWFLQKVMAVPSAVTYTDTMQESQFATLAYLAARPDLSLVSVWSPTFWLTLLEQLEQWRPLLAETLNSGIWTLPGFSSPLKAPLNPRAAVILQTFSGVDLFNQLWPNLALISCWDSAGSQTWAQKIREFHPRVRVQGKGLWTTEGVVTVPFQHQYPAATTSHFFEWIDLDSGKISPTWELRKGQMVQPVLTGGHGLLRYKINDALEVTGQLGLTPTFTFHGRLRETDLVGEKLSPRLAMDTFDFVEKNTGAQVMSMFAVRTENKKPYYLLLARESSASPEKIKMAAEESLSKVFHYKLARELGQLDEVHVRIEKQPELFYQEIFERKGMVSGNIKVEPLSEIREELLS